MTSEIGVVGRATLRAVRYRAFPVAVEIDGTLHSPALVFATDAATEVYVSGENRIPRLVASYPPTVERQRAKGAFVGGRKVRFVAAFDDGTSLAVAQAAGCGCGHPLRSWSPPAEVSA